MYSLKDYMVGFIADSDSVWIILALVVVGWLL